MNLTLFRYCFTLCILPSVNSSSIMLICHSDSRLDEELRFYFNIPSPKSQFRKEPSPKVRSPLLNPNASLHANRLARPARYSRRTKQYQIHSKMIAVKARRPSHAEAPLYMARQSSPSPRLPTGLDRATIQIDIEESSLKVEHETDIAAADWPDQRNQCCWQWTLDFWIY